MSENFESQGNCKTSLFSRRCRTGKNDTVYKCILYQLYQLLHDMFDMSKLYFNKLYFETHDFKICECLILQAVSYQKKAVIVCERVFGVDHPDTVIAYVRANQFSRPVNTKIKSLFIQILQCVSFIIFC